MGSLLGHIKEYDIRRVVSAGGTITMVFTDIVGSTEIKPKLPGRDERERDEYYVEHIQKPHHEIIRKCYGEYDGIEVKTIGDAFFLTFEVASKAVLCAAEIQQRLEGASIPTPIGPLKIRIGMHTGSPIEQSGDYIGSSVDKAARVEDLGTGSQVLLSEQTYSLVKGQIAGFRFHPHGEFPLKGLPGLHPIYEALWKGKSPQETKRPAPKVGVEKDVPLRVRLTSSEVAWGSEKTPLDPPLDAGEFAADTAALRRAANPDISNPEEAEKDMERVTQGFLKELGGKFFARAFADERLLDRYWETSGELHIDISSDLSSLPWELMHDGDEFIALKRSLIRVVKVEARGRKPKKHSPGPLKTLVAMSSPLLDRWPPSDGSDQPDLIDLEQQAYAFRNLEGKSFAADFRLYPHITLDEFDSELAEGYALLHFVGHGGPGVLAFEDRHGVQKAARVDEIKRIISGANDLQLVVLESCLTSEAMLGVSVAGAFLEGGISMAVAMQESITVEAGTIFAEAFYNDIARGRGVSQALSRARRSIQRAYDPGRSVTENRVRPWEWAMPVLFWDGEGEPDLKAPEGNVVIREPERRVLSDMLKRDPNFIGRRKELVEIARALDPKEVSGANVVVLHGLGGVGKTALAIEAANRTARWFPEGNVFWQSARGELPPEEIESEIAGVPLETVEGDYDFLLLIGRGLGCELKGSEKWEELISIIHSRLSDGRLRLLVLDNLDALYRSRLILRFLDKLPGECRALVTSRHGLSLDHAEMIRVWLKSVGGSEFTPPAPGRWSRPTVGQQDKSHRVVGVDAGDGSADSHPNHH